MNRIIIAGRLVRDPDLRVCNSGTEVCNLTVAVDRKRAKKDHEKETDFIDCTAWGKTGVFVSKYFKKGDGITVEGRMESRKWVDKDGNNRTSWGVTVDEVEFPLGKNGGGSDNGLPFTMGDGDGDFQEVEDDGSLPF